LEDEGGFEECAAGVLFALRERAVRGICCSVAVQGFDDTGDCAEGSEDAAGVDGRVVGDVIENTGEDEVICQFVQRTELLAFVAVKAR
jgi:hypothetical protein